MDKLQMVAQALPWTEEGAVFEKIDTIAGEVYCHTIKNSIWLCWLSCYIRQQHFGGETQFKDPNCLVHHLEPSLKGLQLKWKNDVKTVKLIVWVAMFGI